MHLVHELTYHPYFANPDANRGDEAALQGLVAGFLGAGGAPVRAVQGEVGCPSTNMSYGALDHYPWTECTQAKWLSRRILGDAARSLQSSIFLTADVCYSPQEGYSSGLLAINCSAPSLPVAHVRKAYGVVSRLFGLLDSSWAPAGPKGTVGVECAGLAPGDTIATALFLGGANGTTPLAAVWLDSAIPADPSTAAAVTCSVNVTMATAAPPPASAWVIVDTLTGSVWAPPAAGPDSTQSGGGLTGRASGGASALMAGVAVSDFVTLVAPAVAVGPSPARPL